MKRLAPIVALFLTGCAAMPHQLSKPIQAQPQAQAAPAPTKCAMDCALVLTAAQVFDRSMIGKTWPFVNGYGDMTWITVEPSPYCEFGTCDGQSVTLHYTKSDCRAYWNPGACGDELWFVLHEEEDGSWRCIGFKAIVSGQWITVTPTPIAGQPLPYLIIPAQAQGDTITVNTAYHWLQQTGVLTDDAIVPDLDGGIVPWRTDSYIDNGQMVSGQWEGTVHEKWWFAPGKGLVKVQPIVGVNNVVLDPQLTMVRVEK